MQHLHSPLPFTIRMNTESYDRLFAVAVTGLIVGGLLGYALGTGRLGGASCPSIAPSALHTRETNQNRILL